MRRGRRWIRKSTLKIDIFGTIRYGILKNSGIKPVRQFLARIFIPIFTRIGLIGSVIGSQHTDSISKFPNTICTRNRIGVKYTITITATFKAFFFRCSTMNKHNIVPRKSLHRFCKQKPKITSHDNDQSNHFTHRYFPFCLPHNYFVTIKSSDEYEIELPE